MRKLRMLIAGAAVAGCCLAGGVGAWAVEAHAVPVGYLSEVSASAKRPGEYRAVLLAFYDDSTGVEKQFVMLDCDSCLSVKTRSFPLRWRAEKGFLTVETSTGEHFPRVACFRQSGEPGARELKMAVDDALPIGLFFYLSETDRQALSYLLGKEGAFTVTKSDDSLLMRLVESEPDNYYFF